MIRILGKEIDLMTIGVPLSLTSKFEVSQILGISRYSLVERLGDRPGGVDFLDFWESKK